MLGLVRSIAPRSWFAGSAAAAITEEVDEREPLLIEGSLEIGGRPASCTIVDVTSRAARVRLDEPCVSRGVFVGQQALLRPLGGKPVSTVVRRFDEQSLILKFMTAANLGTFGARCDRLKTTQPRPSRAQVDIASEIIAGTTTISGKIVNISSGGVLVHSKDTLVPGSSVMLQSDLLRPIGGYVRWRRENAIGIMFNRLLPFESAQIVAQSFDLHPIWLEEISECHRS